MNEPEVCKESKNLLYKNRMVSGTSMIPTTPSDTMDNLDIFLENEKQSNKIDSWNKLDKTMKMRKCNIFIEEYAKANYLSVNDKLELTDYIKDCIDRKKLSRTKDVIYNMETGMLEQIPTLLYANNRFTLRSINKKTLSSEGLGPKKNENNKMENDISTSSG
tara:strand:+ start:145 stop:630 length:486 start_codon:yes stop_codon:yes gene_type:complete